MSTEYETVPKIEFERYLLLTSVNVSRPLEKIFINESAILNKNGQYIHVRKDESGFGKLIRFGKNDINKIFPDIIKELTVEIIDEYGLKYPDCVLCRS